MTARKPTRAKALGVTDAEYARLLAAQDGHCAICPATPKTRRLHVDHDHKTGEVRGLLCHRCNRALPAWMTPRWLLDAAEYLGADTLERGTGGEAVGAKIVAGRVYRDGGLTHLPGPNPGTPYTSCGLDAGAMLRTIQSPMRATVWCTACLTTVTAGSAATPEPLPTLDDLAPLLLQVLDEDEAMSAFQVLTQNGYRIVRSVEAEVALEDARKALEFYGKPANWHRRHVHGHDYWSDVMQDCGDIARAVLSAGAPSAETTNDLAAKITILVCPVCQGRGTVANGFYSSAPSSTDTNRETCQSCCGRGVV